MTGLLDCVNSKETPAGVVRTAEEIRRAEEEQRLKKEEEERIAREEAERLAREEAEERRRNSPLSKLGRWLKSTATKIVEDEE